MERILQTERKSKQSSPRLEWISGLGLLSLCQGGDTMRILEDLWYSNICPIEQAGYRSEDSKTLLELFNRNGAKLESTLNEDEKETLEKMKECWLEMQQYAECSAFINGFRLAVQLMTAASGEPPDLRA